jgi:multidrug transporter EmrE-like cation transporter
MKINTLNLARTLVMFFPLIGLLLGLNFSVIYPVWIAASAILLVLTLIVWYKEGRSFKPFVPMTLVLIGALAIVGLWLYFQP